MDSKGGLDLEGGLKVRPDPLVATLDSSLLAGGAGGMKHPGMPGMQKPMDKPGTKRAGSEEAVGSPSAAKRNKGADEGMAEEWLLNGGIKVPNMNDGSEAANKQVRRNRKMMPAAYEPATPVKDGKSREDAWMAESAEDQRRIFEEKATAEEREAFRLSGGAGGKGEGDMIMSEVKPDSSNKEKKPR